MKTKFLTVLFLFFACIFISNAQQRIIGGETIDISQAPYQVAIFNNSKQTFGGGMLLNNQWILTAKHIVEGASASTIKISLGHNNPSTDTNRLSISQIVFYSSSADDDIALLKLSSPVTFSSNIAPIYISSGTSYTINTSCEVTGWGRTSINGSSPNPQLKRCEVSLQSCSGKNIYTKPSSNTPFKGDSGGALTIDASGYKMAIGIVAGGDSDNPTSTSVRYMNIVTTMIG